MAILGEINHQDHRVVLFYRKGLSEMMMVAPFVIALRFGRHSAVLSILTASDQSFIEGVLRR